VDTTAAAPTTDKATEVLRVVTACAAAPSVALCNNVVLWTPSRALALRAASVTARANAGLAAASVQGSSIGIDVTLDRDKTALYVTLTIRRRTWAVLGQHFLLTAAMNPHRIYESAPFQPGKQCASTGATRAGWPHCWSSRCVSHVVLYQ
jgi:hypothetical protein